MTDQGGGGGGGSDPRQAEWEKLPEHVKQQYWNQHRQQQHWQATQAGRRRMPPWRIALNAIGAVALLIIPAGFVHCTCGGGQGPGICRKESWGIGDTFVDLDEYIGKPMITTLSKAHVVRALVRCEKLQLPASWRR